jgi:pantoate--beta-alanine ligase
MILIKRMNINMNRIVIKMNSNCSKLFCRNISIVKSIDDMRKINKQIINKKIGFVPTMGALHEGHITLMKRAREENEIVISSIFVNPTQFSAGEDLDKYPRTFDKDLAMLKAVGVDYVFAPDTKDMYPSNALCHVEPAMFSSISEGVARPDFFRGVATVVCKLFNIVQPSIAYFGQKDISQCILVKSLVSDLNIPVQIQVCETIRESDGLAMSSRNTYLTKNERPHANILFKALSLGKDMFSNASVNDIISAAEIIKNVEKKLKSEPLVSKIEYISIASHLDMKELSHVSLSKGAVISSAIRLGSVRLIDNLLIGIANDEIYTI